MSSPIHLRSLSVALLLLTMGSASAVARLGDTERQCVERYGSAISSVRDYSPLMNGAHQLASYKYQGLLIKVAFLNGKVVRQTYQREKIVNGSLDLSDLELAAILSAESGGGEWKPISPFKPQGANIAVQAIGMLAFRSVMPTWERSTDKATAQCTGHSRITLDTPEAKAAEAAFEAARKSGVGRPVPKF